MSFRLSIMVSVADDGASRRNFFGDLMTHPELARPRDVEDSMRLLRVLCTGFILSVILLPIGVSMVVWLSLGGQPLAGNRIVVSGVPVVTAIAVTIALLLPFVAWFVARTIAQGQIEELAKQNHVEERELFKVFAYKTFIEFAMAEGLMLLLALTLHITADPYLAIGLGTLLLFMLMRFPRRSRINDWLAETAQVLADKRNERLT